MNRLPRALVVVLVTLAIAVGFVVPLVAQTPTPAPATGTVVATTAATTAATVAATTAATTAATAEATTAATAEATVAATAVATPDLTTAAGILAAWQGDLVQLYSNVIDSVVGVEVLIGAQQGTSSQGSPFGQQAPQGALGSGFVWDTAGHIITNNHVVAQAEEVDVVFNDGTVVTATVVGTDPDSDLAVIKVDVPADQLKPMTIADSTAVQVGELAVAIGNPFGFQGTMTVGIVSAIGRLIPVEQQTQGSSSYNIPDAIQTDAAVNPGNSGGPLLNSKGEVIGVNTSIISPAGANAGVGFAIPSEVLQREVPSLIETGSYQHVYLGLSGGDLSPRLAQANGLPADQRGVVIGDITPGGPADQAGLQGSARQATVSGLTVRVGGDVITAVNGQPVRTFTDLLTYLSRFGKVGEAVELTILRGGQEQTVSVTLQARPKQTAPVSTTSGAKLGIAAVAMTSQIAQAMNLPADTQGVLVGSVQQGSPADNAGIRGGFRPATINGQQLLIGGDVITAIDGQPVTKVSDIRTILAGTEAGSTITLTVLRDGASMDVDVTLP